jgi:hypothetical protein
MRPLGVGKQADGSDGPGPNHRPAAQPDARSSAMHLPGAKRENQGSQHNCKYAPAGHDRTSSN